MKERHKVSWHLKDLCRLDAKHVAEIANWLEERAVTPRDIANRAVSKVLLARLVASKIAMKACDGDVAAAREFMDRTEGKVTEHISFDVSGEITHRLEAARCRLLKSAEPEPQDMVVDGELPRAEISAQSQPSPNESDPKS